MRRRDFLILTAGVAGGRPTLSRAQQKAMPVIGILGAVSPDVTGVQLNLAAFREGLGETGFAEGQNVVVEYRWAERRLDRLPALAAELVARKVDVIVTEGGDSTTFAAKQATSTIPVVFHCTSDPVALGIVASLARPGGNLTGVSLMHSELALKLFEMLLEVVPEARLIGVLRDPSSPLDIEHAASARNVRLHILPAFSFDEVDAAFAALVPLKPDGLIIYSAARLRSAALASRHSLPAISYARDFPENGGLLSYGPSSCSLQLYVSAADECTTFDPPWPDLFRPPTSSPIVPSTGKKAIGVGKVWASPPSEPCVRFSRTRLSSRWVPHRECLAW
jgi:putative ABC transport system substrate-binding protein